MKFSRLWSSILAAALLAAFALVTPAAADAPTIAASGKFTTLTFVQSNFRVVNGYTLFDFDATADVFGTLTSTTPSKSRGRCVMDAAKKATCVAQERFTGTVAGRTGTATFVELLNIDFNTFNSTGSATIVSGTGGLRNLRGDLTFLGGPTGGTYSGRLFFIS